MPRSIGAALSGRLVTLHQLQTELGVRDLYDVLEVQAVDAQNERRLRAASATKGRG